MFIGNLGKDADLRYTPGGAAVATFSMACNEVWTDKAGQKQERVEWVRVNVWGKTAESISEYLVKGKQVFVEGKMQTRDWTDKDGIKRYMTEIRADRVLLLSSARNGPPHPADTAADGPDVSPADAQLDDDIPF
jgi:single-strand DNA-binding protein